MTSRLTHERAKMGLFHEGDVASAIAAAKAKGKPLLVFILGTDSASAAMERALDGSGSDDEGGDLRDEAGHAGWVAVRLEEGGTDAANFRALCPAEPAPVAVAVDTTTGAKIGEASNEDLSFVAANLEVFRQTHEADLRLRTMTALAQLAGAQASAPSRGGSRRRQPRRRSRRRPRRRRNPDRGIMTIPRTPPHPTTPTRSSPRQRPRPRWPPPGPRWPPRSSPRLRSSAPPRSRTAPSARLRLRRSASRLRLRGRRRRNGRRRRLG